MGYVSFDLGDAYGGRAFGPCSFLEMVPKITIRSGFPIEAVLGPFVEMTKYCGGSVEHCLAISSYVDWPMGSKGNDSSSQLCSSGASSISSNRNIEHEPILVKSTMGKLVFSLAKPMPNVWVPIRPPRPSPTKAKALLERIDPAAICIAN